MQLWFARLVELDDLSPLSGRQAKLLPTLKPMLEHFESQKSGIL